MAHTAFESSQLGQERQPLPNAGASLRRNLHHPHAGPDALDVVVRRLGIKLDGIGYIDLCDYRHVGRVENCRILERLVFPFGDGQHNETQRFAEVVAGRTNKVADVFRISIPGRTA